MTATLPAPHRITRWQWTRARLAVLIGLEAHHGATTDWHPLTELPPPVDDLAPTDVQILTGECLRTVTDELGRWVPDLYDLEPARLFDAVLLGTTAGAPFRTGGVA